MPDPANDFKVAKIAPNRVGLTEDGAGFSGVEAKQVLKETGVRPRAEMLDGFGRIKVDPLLGALQVRFPNVRLAISFTNRGYGPSRLSSTQSPSSIPKRALA